MGAWEGWTGRLYQRGTLALWLALGLPLWAVLVYTGLMDPAQGHQPGTEGFWMYLPAGAALVAFSMGLNLLKGFFVLHFGRVNCGMLESGRRLARVHGLMLVLEALATFALFHLRGLPGYRALEQGQLFGHELLYAALLAGYLWKNGETSLRRTVAVGLCCFLVSAAWLLLSVIAGLL